MRQFRCARPGVCCVPHTHAVALLVGNAYLQFRRAHPRRRPEGGALNAAQRRGKKRRRAGAAEERTATFKAPSTSRVPLSWTPPADAVSRLENPETGSTVWLVGIVHQAAPYIEVRRMYVCMVAGPVADLAGFERGGKSARVGVGVLD